MLYLIFVQLLGWLVLLGRSSASKDAELLGDPAAEDYARHAAARSEANGQRRRVATARLDLGLVLARLGRPDEAAHCGVLALESNELVPSNAWRADELLAAVSGYHGVPEVEELRELSAQRCQG